jgi:hypothetical protein
MLPTIVPQAPEQQVEEVELMLSGLETIFLQVILSQQNWRGKTLVELFDCEY